MKKNAQINIINPSICHFCGENGLVTSNIACPKCGFPQNGTQAQMKIFLHGKRKQKGELIENQQNLNYKHLGSMIYPWFILAIGAFYFMSDNSNYIHLILSILTSLSLYIFRFNKNKEKQYKPLISIAIITIYSIASMLIFQGEIFNFGLILIYNVSFYLSIYFHQKRINQLKSEI